MAGGGWVLVVGGRVRRGVPSRAPVGAECEACGAVASMRLTAMRAGTTDLCGDCWVKSGPPEGRAVPVVCGLECATVQAVRAAVALGWIGDARAAFRAAEQWEREQREWAKATKRHGFRRREADPSKRRHLAIWNPYGGGNER